MILCIIYFFPLLLADLVPDFYAVFLTLFLADLLAFLTPFLALLAPFLAFDGVLLVATFLAEVVFLAGFLTIFFVEAVLHYQKLNTFQRKMKTNLGALATATFFVLVALLAFEEVDLFPAFLTALEAGLLATAFFFD